MDTKSVFPLVAVLDVKVMVVKFNWEGIENKVRYIPPPYPPVHEVRDVSVIVRESKFPISPFTHVPFPDEYDSSENVHPLIVVVAVNSSARYCVFWNNSCSSLCP